MSKAQSFYGLCLRSLVHSLTIFPGLCHSSACPGVSQHMTQFYQAFPTLVVQVTNPGVRRTGYKARFYLGSDTHILELGDNGFVNFLPSFFLMKVQLANFFP